MMQTANPEKWSWATLSSRDRSGVIIFSIGLVLSIFINQTATFPSLWGFTPIILYAILALLGIDIVVATIGALFCAIIIVGIAPKPLAELLAKSAGSFIAIVGLIVILGGALGQVTKETRVAENIVRIIMYRVGIRTRTQIQIGIMLSSTILVAALGTMFGANAILAPIVIPIAGAVGFTPAAVAAMFHAAGAPGLFLGPFTPPVVTLTGAAKINYLSYLLHAGIPMALTTWITGFFMIRFIQRRTEGIQAYSEADLEKEERPLGPEVRRGTWVFVLTILIMVVYGIYIKAGYSLALLVMIVASFTTGFSVGFSPIQILRAMYTGASRIIWLFILFWLFNPFLELVSQTKAYEALLEIGKPVLAAIGPYGFTLLASVIGWLGVAGAAVGQVVLMNQIFAPIVTQLGIAATAWVAVLLVSSQLDWFGPFPNSDLIGLMGLARSDNLRMQLYNGWAIMAVNCLMFSILLFFLT